MAPYKGTIVFLSGGDGTSPSTPETKELMFADYYYSQGYEIVQVEWQYSWEQTNVPSQSGGTYPPNIQYAACRPATFLNFVHANLYSNSGNAGMCVQGDSAGSAATAYSLAYYGAQNYIDAVELTAGPVLSDIEQGCEEPPPKNLLVCGQNNGSQIGCKLGGLSPWLNGPSYTGGAEALRSWTTYSCGNRSGTSSTWNTAWYQMSVVDDGTNSHTFSYPTTAMSAWLCQSVATPVGTDCSVPANFNSCPNNSSAQGQLFYQAITANGVTQEQSSVSAKSPRSFPPMLILVIFKAVFPSFFTETTNGALVVSTF